MTQSPGVTIGSHPGGSEDQSRIVERRYYSRAGNRAYSLCIPSAYRGSPLPLVVMLHGCSQTPRDFAIGTRMSELAEEQSFLVAYPDQPRSANIFKGWNWYKPGNQRHGRGEPAIIAGITCQVMRDFNIDPRRVFVAGLSAGGAAAAIMGATYPELYAVVGIHSGMACGSATSASTALTVMRRGAPIAPIRPTRPVPTIAFHGDRDRTVSPVNGDQAVAQAQPSGRLFSTITHGQTASGMRFTRTETTETDGKTTSEHWLLHGAGHAWAGGNPAGSYTDPAGPDATREMLRFFLSHAQSCGPLQN